MQRKRKALPKALRREVWIQFIGNQMTGVCFVCERAPIQYDGNVEYGHVIAVACGGPDTVENLRPVCASCNRSMGKENLLSYKARLARMGITKGAPAATPGATTREMRNIARNTGTTVGTAIQENIPSEDIPRAPMDPLFLTQLNRLSDCEINGLALILGVMPSTREEIAARKYKLPRQLSAQTFSGVVAENFIKYNSATLVSMVFGVPFAGATDMQVRNHARSRLGFA